MKKKERKIQKSSFSPPVSLQSEDAFSQEKISGAINKRSPGNFRVKLRDDARHSRWIVCGIHKLSSIFRLRKRRPTNVYVRASPDPFASFSFPSFSFLPSSSFSSSFFFLFFFFFLLFFFSSSAWYSSTAQVYTFQFLLSMLCVFRSVAQGHGERVNCNEIIQPRGSEEGGRHDEARGKERRGKGVGCVVGTRVSLFAPDRTVFFAFYGEFMCVKAHRNAYTLRLQNGTEGVYLSGEFFCSLLVKVSWRIIE